MKRRKWMEERTSPSVPQSFRQNRMHTISLPSVRSTCQRGHGKYRIVATGRNAHVHGCRIGDANSSGRMSSCDQLRVVHGLHLDTSSGKTCHGVTSRIASRCRSTYKMRGAYCSLFYAIETSHPVSTFPPSNFSAKGANQVLLYL